MQLGAKESENERFAHYLTKTYRKTASLIANTLKAVSFTIYIYLPIFIYILFEIWLWLKCFDLFIDRRLC